MKRPLAAAALALAALVVVPATAAEPAPPRVTGASFLLDVMTTGNNAGLGLVYNLGTSTLFLVVPPGSLPDPAKGLVLQAAGVSQDALTKVQAGGNTFLTEGRSGIAPLAAYDQQANKGVEAVADVLLFLGRDLGAFTGPFDVTLVEMAAIVRTLEEG